MENDKKIFEGSIDKLSIYSKYKIFIKDFLDFKTFRKYLLQENILSFKFDSDENSLVIAAQI
ncbi:hypothetical protein [Spiroplasma endosymbiont of Cantharis rufa]|uniref:hypothetical protein n=1 Tax=Spiroplasma endosymbiont of Cantharis rufa TaxID=3066279 RepID=UPI0030CE4DB0